MKTRVTYILLIVAAMICCSCQRRPLYYDDANVHVVFDFDSNMPNVAEPPVPELMRVLFFSQYTQQLLYNEYASPQGDYFKIAPAAYSVVTYNFDTEVTQVRNEEDIDMAEVYTSRVNANMLASYYRLFKMIGENRSEGAKGDDYTSQPLLNQPDILYYGRLTNVTVPNRHDDDDSYTVLIPVSSAVKTYRLEISSLTGAQYLLSAEVYVTGQIESKLLLSQSPTGIPCCINVPMNVTSRSSDLVATFTTFGHHPDVPAFVVLNLVDLYGNSQIFEWNVTDQFDDPANDKLIIHINHDITISPPEVDPLAPKVTIWNQSDYLINL